MKWLKNYYKDLECLEFSGGLSSLAGPSLFLQRLETLELLHISDILCEVF